MIRQHSCKLKSGSASKEGSKDRDSDIRSVYLQPGKVPRAFEFAQQLGIQKSLGTSMVNSITAIN